MGESYKLKENQVQFSTSQFSSQP